MTRETRSRFEPARHALRAAFLVRAGLIGLALCLTPALGVAQEEIDAAIADLSAADPERRLAGADTAGRLGSPVRDRVLPHLRRLLREDPDWRVRASSGRAIGRLAARDAMPDLVRALRDSVVDVRVVAAAAIWRLPDPAAVPALLELLRDEDPSARQWACLALGVIHDRRSTAPLLTLLSDPEAAVRLDAIRSLGRLRDPAATAGLEAHAREVSHPLEERLEAVNSISSLEGPEKGDALVRLLRVEPPAMREQAASALGRVGDALMIPPLRERRRAERVASVRTAIDAALREIEARGRGQGSAAAGTPLNLPPLP